MSRDLFIDSKSPRTGLDLPELWRHRELFVVLIQRDIAVRYQETTLGALWAVLQPLGLMAIFAIVFGRIAGMSTGTVPYPLFALAGLLPWLFFASSLQASGTSVLNSRDLISKVYFPRLLIPLTAICTPLADLCVSSVLMLVLMLCYGMPLTLHLLMIPPLALIAALAAAGAGSLIAALSVAYRDFRHVLPFLITAWMFLTPVIYPPAMVPGRWHWLLLLNPMAGVVDGMRSAWFGLAFDFELISISALLAMLLFWCGIRYFRSVERRFVDLL